MSITNRILRLNSITFLTISFLFIGHITLGQKSEKSIQIGQILTPEGEILISLDHRTPKHKASFIEIANAGYWDSLSFNRVIPNFVAHARCPDTRAGCTDADYLLEPAFVPEHTHTYGAIAPGRDDWPG